VILLGRQQAAPFGFGAGDRVILDGHVGGSFGWFFLGLFLVWGV
jgi:hypothetical protein